MYDAPAPMRYEAWDSGEESGHRLMRGWRVPGVTERDSPTQLVDETAAMSSDGVADVMFLARIRTLTQGIAAALEWGGVIYDGQDHLNNWSMDTKNRMEDRTAEGHRSALFDALQRIRGVTAGSLEGSNGSMGLSQFGGGVASRLDPADVHLRVDELEALVTYTRSDFHTKNRTQIESNVKAIKGETGQVQLSGPQSVISEWFTPDFWETYANGPGAASALRRSNSDGGLPLGTHDIRMLERAMKRYEPGVTISGPITGVKDPNDGRVTDRDRVKVMTIHASKGSQARDVVLYDGITSRIRTGMETDPIERDNEYRVWYVACTRASERLHLMLNSGGFDWPKPFMGRMVSV